MTTGASRRFGHYAIDDEVFGRRLESRRSLQPNSWKCCRWPTALTSTHYSFTRWVSVRVSLLTSG